MEKDLIVYKIIFKNSEKCYIGITNNLNNRKCQHVRNANKGADLTISKAIRKHKEPIFEILETVDNTQQLFEKEKHYIEKYDSYNNGYNDTLGGQGSFGSSRSQSEEWKKKHSIRMSGENNPRYGVQFTSQEKEKHSTVMKEYYEKNSEKKPWGNKACSGKIWINNDVNEKKIDNNTILPDGYTKGRLKKNKME